MTLSIGIGLYPAATPADALLALPRPGAVALVMSSPSESRHDLAALLTASGHHVIRRLWQPDPQLDWASAPEAEAARWSALVLGGLAPDAFRAIYAGAVGPNECYGDPSRFAWLAAFELGLALQLQAVEIPYYWGSIQVGCVEPDVFASTFARVNQVAAGVCYHMYAAPNVETLEGPAIPWFARRPSEWWAESQKRKTRFPPLLLGEAGTYYPWHPKVSSQVYVNLLGQLADLLASWRAQGMPVLGLCAFALGAEGTMGDQWNLDRDALARVGTWNARADVDYSLPVEAKPVTQYSSPNHDGPRAQTRGVVIHSTRGGAISLQAEYDATVAWFNAPASQVSAHVVIGPNGQIALPVWQGNVAWHARSYNESWLGIELCQPKHGDPLDPGIVDDAAKVVATWAHIYGFPLVWSIESGLAEHWEIPPGIADGKTDIQAPFDRAAFLALVKKYYGSEDPLTDQQKAAVLDDLDFIYAYAKVENIVKDPAEAQRVIQSRAIALKTTLGLNG